MISRTIGKKLVIIDGRKITVRLDEVNGAYGRRIIRSFSSFYYPDDFNEKKLKKRKKYKQNKRIIIYTKSRTQFFKKTNPLKKEDQIGKAIADTFNKINKTVTPSEIASYLKIHPNTVKDRINKFEKKGYLKCRKDGNRIYCKRIKKIKI